MDELDLLLADESYVSKRALASGARVLYSRPFEQVELYDTELAPVRGRLFNSQALAGLSALFSLQDGRLWRPERSRPVYQVGGSFAHFEPFPRVSSPRADYEWQPPAGPFSNPGYRRRYRQAEKILGYPKVMPAKVAFRNPHRVVICLKRRIRREVMFALNRRFKGARARRHRWKEFSSVIC